MSTHTSVPRLLHRTAGALAIVAAAGIAGFDAGHAFSAGAITTFATVPAPGFPEGIVVHGNRVFVSGAAWFGTAGQGPSAIEVYDRKTGAHVDTISVTGEALAYQHVLSNIASDGSGRIYALSMQLGVIRFTKQAHGYVQEPYGAPLPDLPICAAVSSGPCSPTAFDLPPLANDIVFDEDGFAYVSDSLQATIFRYAPGGGPPQIWFQSTRLEGGGFLPFGTNGLRLDPSRQHLYVAVSGSAAAPNVGPIYRLPLVNAPADGALTLVHEYVGGEFPDQLAFGAGGELYVSLALSNQISVLSVDGTEIMRIESAPGDAVPLDAPAAIAFDSRTKSLLIVNHAFLSGEPSHFAVLAVAVADPGDALDKPSLP
jgi:sugar lactone lactonase YvrE